MKKNLSSSITTHPTPGHLNDKQQQQANSLGDGERQKKYSIQKMDKMRYDNLPLITAEGELKCLLYKEGGVTHVSQALVSAWSSGHVVSYRNTDGQLLFVWANKDCSTGLHGGDELSEYEVNVTVLLFGIMETGKVLGMVKGGEYELTAKSRIELCELLKVGFNPTDEELLWAAHELQEQVMTDDEFRQMFRVWRQMTIDERVRLFAEYHAYGA
jgi:hypothetical protein